MCKQTVPSKDEKVRSYYDSFSPSYDSMYSSIQKYKFLQFSEELDRFKQKSWIIDIGSGTSLIAEFMDTEFIALDISFGMLQEGITKERKIFPIQATMTAIPIRSRSMIGLLSFTALQNSSNISLALQQIERIIHDESRIIISILRKKINKTSFEKLLKIANFDFIQLPTSGEDYMYQISKLISSSSGS